MAKSNFFLDAIFTPSSAAGITAHFKDGTSADYTRDIFELLKSDENTEAIIDTETGAVVWMRANIAD